MRPTRFTRKPRRTKWGRGGWGISPFVGMLHYTHPITGDGYSSDNLHTLLRMRKTNETNQKPPDVKGVTWEP